MAAKKTAEARKAPKKSRGRKPVKRTINLLIVNENRINPLKAIPAIILIVALAAVFSKFLVIDRLAAVSTAESRAAQVQMDLDNTNALLAQFGEVETTYAHYTQDGMTAAELNQVDRVQVLRLVVSTLPVIEPRHVEANVDRFLKSLFRPAPRTGNGALDAARLAAREALKAQLIPSPEYTVNSWSVEGNLLRLNVNGQSLERLNQLARQIETSPIVNTVTIITANKSEAREVAVGVNAQLLVYLQKAVEVPEDEAAAEDKKTPDAFNFGAVTQFVGGEASQQ